MYQKDDAGQFENLALGGANVNDGFVLRNSFIRRSRSVNMIGRIHADVFFQGRYLLNEGNVKIKMIISRDAFCVMGGAQQFKLIIESTILYVRKVKLSPSVFLAHAKALESSTAKYPLRRVTCKTITMPADHVDISHEKLFTGQLPNRVVIGLIRNDAFSGSRTHNP